MMNFVQTSKTLNYYKVTNYTYSLIFYHSSYIRMAVNWAPGNEFTWPTELWDILSTTSVALECDAEIVFLVKLWKNGELL